MAFNTQEQEIIKYGIQNGKSKQEVEQAISNYRAGVVPKKKVETTPVQTGSSLGTKLVDRATTFGKEALALGTLGASTVSKQDLQEAKTSPEQRNLIGLEAFNRAFQAPAEMAMAAGGAIGDVVGAGLQATGLDKTIATAVAPVVTPVVQSEGAKKLVDNFHKLPQDTQEYLKGIPDIANLIGVDVIPSAISKATAKTALTGSAFDAIKGSTGNLTGKALDFISSDPGAKVETILKRSTPQELDNYLSIAEKSAQSGEAKSVFEAVGDKLSDTTKTLKTKLDGIGAAKSQVINNTPAGAESFAKETVPFIQKLNEIKRGISEIDKSNLPKVQAVIDDATLIKTKAQADAFIDKVQNLLYTGNKDMTIPTGSALDRQLKSLLGEYNTKLKANLPPEYSALNDQYSQMVDTLGVINDSLGQTVEGVPVRGASLIKQYFSPSGSKAKEIFEFIKKETNGEVDLAKDATLAKFAGQLYDDPNVNSLLGGIKDIPTTASAVVGKVIEKVGGEKATSLLRESTIRKAKSSTVPKELKATSMVDKKMPTESKLLQSSPNTIPKSEKGKGIEWNRGMLNPSEIKKALTPSELSNATLKAQKVDLTTPKELIKIAKGLNSVQRGTIADFLDNTANLDNELKLRKMFGYMGLDENMPKKELERISSLLKDENVASKKKVVNGLEQEAKKYKSAEEFVKAQGKGLPSSWFDYRSKIPNVKGGWTKDKIVKHLKNVGSDYKQTTFNKEILKFDNPQELEQNLFYHGSGRSIGSLKPSITMTERQAEMFGGGGYGERYWGISLSKDRNMASAFTGQARSGEVAPVILKKGAKVKSMPEIQDAVELEDHIVRLWDEGVDAVKIGDWKSEFSEQELVVLNPKAIVVGKGDYFPVYQKPKMPSFDEKKINEMFQEALPNWKKLREEERRIFVDNFKAKYGREPAPNNANDIILDEYFKTKSQLEEIWNKAHVKEVSLEEEAKKYKSAEEFVKAHGTPIFRGGTELSKEKITNSGISFSRGKNVAEDFAKQKGGTVKEYLISPKAKIINYSEIPDVKFKHLNDYSSELDTGNKQIWRDLEVEYQKAVDWAKNNGYDVVKLPLEGETRVINPDVIKTKSELTDIWKKANKK